jgi:hypothetical protein
MASFLRAARPAGREWTVEEAAVYAARRDFELLKLLSTDKRALRTARMLGVHMGMQQQAQQAAAAPHVAATQEQPAVGSNETERQRRKRRPPNAARRQKQRERAQQKRMKQKLFAVLPIVHKWAQAQSADAEMAEASPLSSTPREQQRSGTGDSTAAQVLTEQLQQSQRSFSYADVVQLNRAAYIRADNARKRVRPTMAARSPTQSSSPPSSLASSPGCDNT